MKVFDEYDPGPGCWIVPLLSLLAVAVVILSALTYWGIK